jgi:hypothetical protein
MKKVIRLTEKDLQIIVKRVLNEGHTKSKYGILNESYLPAVQEGDSECDIVCERKQAKFGSNGSLVKRIQHGLSKCGFNVEREGGGMMSGCKDDPNKCDGLFRKETKKAVEEFQKKYGLQPIDGAVGKKTIEKLKGVGCMEFKQCSCNTQQDDDIYIEDYYDKFDCEKLKSCLNSMGKDWCMDDLNKCLKGEKSSVKKPPINFACGNCPDTINCMPSPGRKTVCDQPFYKSCISKKCTKPIY